MVGIAVDKIEHLSPTETVLELELTPNRSDCLGIINVAREVAIITKSPLRIPDPGIAPGGNRPKAKPPRITPAW